MGTKAQNHELPRPELWACALQSFSAKLESHVESQDEYQLHRKERAVVLHTRTLWSAPRQDCDHLYALRTKYTGELVHQLQALIATLSACRSKNGSSNHGRSSMPFRRGSASCSRSGTRTDPQALLLVAGETGAVVEVVLLDKQRHKVHVLEGQVDLVPQPQAGAASVQQLPRTLEGTLVEVLRSRG